jgi:hypothetical protein
VTRSFYRIGCALAASLAAWTGHAHAGATPDPGDYAGVPAGTNLSLLYLQDIRADDLYANGRRQPLPRDLGLNLRLGLLREVRYGTLGGHAVNAQVIVPFARQRDALSGRAPSGIGDVVMGATVWTTADLARGEHLGYSLFVTAPTGRRRDQGFAISDNRWALDFQAGYLRRVLPNWSLDLVGSAEFFQDRRDTGSDKHPVGRAFAHLRYHLGDTSHVAASLRYTAGGRETLGAALLQGRKSDTNGTLTWAGFVTGQIQLQAQASRDLHVENGPRLNTFGLRALYVH